MPFTQPSRGDVHVNRPLTNISVAYMQRAENFVSRYVFPVVRVKKQGDVYFTYERGDFFRDEMRERAPGTESAGSTYRVGTDSYFAKVWAIHKNVSDQIRANADTPLTPDREAVRFVTEKAMIREERSWADKYFGSTSWTFRADGASSRTAAGSLDFTDTSNNQVIYWDAANSTPVEDVRLFKRTIQESTGFRPNTLTISRKVFDTLVDHEDIIARLNRGQTGGPAMANRDDLARLFELDRILVMDAIYNSAEEGVDAVHKFIGTKHGLLSYSPASPAIDTPSAGYTFLWTGFVGAMSGIRIKRFRMENLASDRVEAEMAFDQKIVSKDLGMFLNGIVQN